MDIRFMGEGCFWVIIMYGYVDVFCVGVWGYGSVGDRLGIEDGKTTENSVKRLSSVSVPLIPFSRILPHPHTPIRPYLLILSAHDVEQRVAGARIVALAEPEDGVFADLLVLVRLGRLDQTRHALLVQLREREDDLF